MSLKALAYEQAKGTLHLVEVILGDKVRAFFMLMEAMPRGYDLALRRDDEI